MFSLIDKSRTIASPTGIRVNPFLYKLSVQTVLLYSAVEGFTYQVVKPLKWSAL